MNSNNAGKKRRACSKGNRGRVALHCDLVPAGERCFLIKTAFEALGGQLKKSRLASECPRLEKREHKGRNPGAVKA